MNCAVTQRVPSRQAHPAGQWVPSGTNLQTNFGGYVRWKSADESKAIFKQLREAGVTMLVETDASTPLNFQTDALDIRRSLGNEPVPAGPPSATSRVRKFARRHRIGVAMAGLLAVLLVAFGATMAVQAQRITRERDRAARESAAAKQVSDFLVGLFNVSDPSEARGNSVTARKILDKGAREISQTLREQPEVQDRLPEEVST